VTQCPASSAAERAGCWGRQGLGFESRAGRKVLFLDIDGVLNDRYTRQAYPPETGEYNPWLPRITGVSPRKVERLNGALERTGAAVVVSSGWRTTIGPDETIAYLRRQGLRGEILGCTAIYPTDDGQSFVRGLDVYDWLAAHPEVERYAIVDDLPHRQFLPGQPLVRTESRSGLQREHVEELVEILGPA
jgi:hypothetical protein